jgi:tetratricopeptide (TPR) repeat protein
VRTLVRFFVVAASLSMPDGDGQASRPIEDFRRRLALVVGNGSYNGAKLRNPLRDAKDVGDMLGRLGFQVDLLQNASLSQMQSGVNRFAARLRPDDIALVYYSGHGGQIGGENYLVPTDYHAKNKYDETRAYPMTRLLAAIDAADLKILIFDACRDNPFVGAPSSAKGLSKAIAGRETFISYATAPGDTASDGDGRNSPFTGALLQVLPLPGLTLDEVFIRVNGIVAQEGPRVHVQVPWYSSTVTKPFHFARATDATAGPVGGNRTKGNDPTNLKKAKRLYARGLTEWRSGRYEKGVADLRASVAANPADAHAHATLGIVLLGSLHLDDAIDQLKDAAIRDPSDSLSFNGLSGAYSQMNQHKRVVEAADRALALDSTLQGMHYTRGTAYMNLGNYERAIQDYSSELTTSVRYPKWLGQYYQFLSYIGRALSYSLAGNEAPAIADLDSALRLRSDAGVVYAIRGDSHKRLGECEAAISDYKKAIAVGGATGLELPREVAGMAPHVEKLIDVYSKQVPYFGMAECYGRLGSVSEALALADRAFQLTPDFNGYNGLGFVRALLGQYQEAIQDFDRALRLNPDFEAAYLNRGNAFEKLGNCSRSLDNYSEAIRLNPQNAWSWNSLSVCHQRLGQPKRAFEDADTALHIKPDLAEALVNRGASHADLKEYDLAIADYTEAIRLKPELALAFHNRARAKRAAGDLGADEDFRRAVELGYKD